MIIIPSAAFRRIKVMILHRGNLLNNHQLEPQFKGLPKRADD